MKKALLITAMLLTGAFTYSQSPNTWTQKNNFKGDARYGAVGFSIGSRGYMGTGTPGFTSHGYVYFKDLWEYDPANDLWTQKADFGGGGRAYAVGVSIGTKGYIGTGDSSIPFQKDFWEYDPVANAWTRKADFGGGGREISVGFSIGSKGYMGTGNYQGGAYKDFWEYDPMTNTWLQKADFGGNARYYAAGFSIGSKGYIGPGSNSLGYLQDFWEYNPATDKWKKKADFAGGPTQAAVSFSIGMNGYIGTGDSYNSGDHTKAFWEYDPATNIWTRKADFGGPGRDQGTGFSIGEKGYLGTGSAANIGNINDFWEYTPSNDTSETVCQPPSDLTVPTISDTAAVLQWALPADPVNGFDILYHVIGSTRIHKRHAGGSTTHITAGDLQPNTIYRWQMRSDCSADTTGWINGPDFTTLSSSAISLNTNITDDATVENNVTVQIMPNPNKGNFSLQMQLPAKAASTVFTLYNSLGKKLWQQDAGMLSGHANRNIELQNKLSAGVYTLMIQHGDASLVQRLVITK